ncbi:hypothetical protein D9757_007895 [Collybiopsis confluens]|uniref:Uncharacterized protein n=1 Tax=Collybiopsis confluens TaxID=2823264 RepID=A0A8H5HDD4_9AGAR|nr:hypothetical protein D9757_007895 [Collybiopsis confluens]
MSMALGSLSAACLSTSPNFEDLKPAQNFRLMKDEDILYRLHRLEYFWGLSQGELDPFSELNHLYVRADVAQLLWSKDIALVPTTEVLATMNALIKDNFLGHFYCRRLCFESVPVQEYEYKLLPIAESGPSLYVLDKSGTNLQRVDYPYHDLPPLKLSLYPFFATTHAGAAFFKKGSTRDPEYSHPIRVMSAVYTCTVPSEFLNTSLNTLPGNSHDLAVLDDESTSDSESDVYSGHERERIQCWIQDAGVSYSKEVSIASEPKEDAASDT